MGSGLAPSHQSPRTYQDRLCQLASQIRSTARTTCVQEDLSAAASSKADLRVASAAPVRGRSKDRTTHTIHYTLTPSRPSIHDPTTPTPLQAYNTNNYHAPPPPSQTNPHPSPINPPYPPHPSITTSHTHTHTHTHTHPDTRPTTSTPLINPRLAAQVCPPGARSSKRETWHRLKEENERRKRREVVRVSREEAARVLGRDSRGFRSGEEEDGEMKRVLRGGGGGVM